MAEVDLPDLTTLQPKRIFHGYDDFHDHTKCSHKLFEDDVYGIVNYNPMLKIKRIPLIRGSFCMTEHNQADLLS